MKMSPDNRRTLLYYITAVAAVAWGIFFHRLAHAEDIAPTADRREVEVRVHWLSHDRTIEQCASLGAWGGAVPRVSAYVGCNVYHPATNVCDVYAARPARLDDQQTTVLGHEVAHCLLGRYHTQEDL